MLFAHMQQKPDFYVGKFPGMLCGYFNDERVMRSITLLPLSRKANDTEFKFKRMQEGYIGNTAAPIATACDPCFACVPIRTKISAFSLSKSQRKLLQSSPLTFSLLQTSDVDLRKLYPTYNKYVSQRHKGSEMSNWSFAAFSVWVSANPFILTAHIGSKIVGFSSIDGHAKELSLDYSAFNPDYSKLSVGKQLWIQTMLLAQRAQLDHVYVGPWASNSPKLDYKRNFRGLESFQGGTWVDFEPEKHKEGPNYKRMLAIAGHPNLN